MDTSLTRRFGRGIYLGTINFSSKNLRTQMKVDLVEPSTLMSEGGSITVLHGFVQNVWISHPLLKSLKDLHVTAG